MKVRKIIALALAAILLVATSVAATVAYFTDSDSVVNTFTVGNIKIELNESDYDKDNDTKKNAYHLLPGLSYRKDPTVTVKAKSEDCYVRVRVSVTYMDDMVKAFPSDFDYSKWGKTIWYKNGLFLLQNLVNGWNPAVWECKDYFESTVKVNENGTEVDKTVGTYEFWYIGGTDGKVVKSENDTVLDAVFTEVVVPGEIDNVHLGYLQNTVITVEAHAIQTAGFTSAAEAWSHWS